MNFQVAAAQGLLVAMAGLSVGPARTTAVPPVAVSGVVFDSLRDRVLAGASVQMVGADSAVARERFTASSDSLGRFRFAAVPAGRYILGFYHIALDALGIEPRGQLLDIRADKQEITLAGPRRGRADRAASATSRDDGWFALCALPSETALTVRGVRDTSAGRSDSSSGVTVRFARLTVQHLSIYVPRAATSAARVPTLRLSGRVAEMNGRAISGAQVWIAGTERRTVTTAAGNYALDSLPSGTQSLEVRAIGYSPRTIVVTLLAGAPLFAGVTMEHAVVLLTVVTLGAKSSKNLATFEAHKRSSTGGYFVKPARLEGTRRFSRCTRSLEVCLA